MKYEKAKDILPDQLLKEVQKYAAGRLLYIPNDDDKRTWGEVSGCKQRIKKRNQMICNKYANGITIATLAEEYYLSEESIKKIVYSKNKDNDLYYYPTLQSAMEYSNDGMLEEWIHSYLLFTCKNKELSDRLFLINRYFIGPVKFPLRLIQESQDNLVGFETKTDQIQDDSCPTIVDDIRSKDLPPLLIHFESGRFILDGDMNRFRACQSNKIKAYPVIIWITEVSDYDLFMKQYGSYMSFRKS